LICCVTSYLLDGTAVLSENGLYPLLPRLRDPETTPAPTLNA
jgi:hypothetical protein